MTVLASGDPFLSGIGSTLVDLLGASRVRVLPAVSSVALASARMGWSAESFDVITVVGRNPAAILRSLSPGRRLIVLSADETTPALVADMLTGAGYGPSAMTVLCDLGSLPGGAAGRDGRGVSGHRDPPAEPDLRAVHPQAVHRAAADHRRAPRRRLRARRPAHQAGRPRLRAGPARPGARSDCSGTSAPAPDRWPSSGPGPIRAAGRSPSRRTRPGPRGSPGTPAGSACPVSRCSPASAPEGLAGLPLPHAIFVGGGASVAGVLENCWQALTVGGRMVVHGVTLETEELLIGWHDRLGGELIRMSVERVGAARILPRLDPGPADHPVEHDQTRTRSDE